MEMQVFTPLPHIAYCFFTRNGGVSDGGFNSLNTSYSTADSPENVTRNRDIIRNTMQARHLCTVSQIHSTLCVEAADALRAPQEADAMITQQPDHALGVMGADCTPVLFYDADQPIIAAAHAGWKGALNGVLDTSVAAMQAKGARNIIAQIGPCIGPKSYEVDAVFQQRFITHNGDAAQFFTPSARATHAMFDLPAYCAWRLRALGVDAHLDHWHDTYSHPDLYFSHRRMTHEARDQEGRQMSVIVAR